MKILVTGGAGYIGSHTVRLLLDKGYEMVVLDNLSNGHSQSVPKRIKFYQADLADKEKLREIFNEEEIEVVIHFAALAEIKQSIISPKESYRNNIVNTINLLDVMLDFDVKKIIFSSSAAVFGIPKNIPIKEEEEKKPINVYGRTKLIIEDLLDDYDTAYGLKSVSLRYFNVAGAGYGIGEDHDPEMHLIPLILQVALGKKENIKIFGTNYPTKDGTCIRDYIHVLDLAEAHILALEKLFKTNEGGKYNLGRGEGYSVKEIIETAREVAGHPILSVGAEKRAGDSPVLIADSTKIKKELNWNPKFSLKDIIKSAWAWHKNNPEGFKGPSFLGGMGLSVD